MVCNIATMNHENITHIEQICRESRMKILLSSWMVNAGLQGAIFVIKKCPDGFYFHSIHLDFSLILIEQGKACLRTCKLTAYFTARIGCAMNVDIKITRQQIVVLHLG